MYYSGDVHVLDSPSLMIKVIKILRELSCVDLLARCNNAKDMTNHLRIMIFGCWD